MTTPLLVFGWGNHSRGDDALGPLFIDRLRALIDQTPAWADTVECLDDYQLQVEHALDLVGRSAVLFVDASLTCTAPFVATQLAPSRDASFTSHAMSPQALLQVYLDLHGHEPPPCTLLAIRGERFGLGEPASPAAWSHLDAAMAWAVQWIADSQREPAATKHRANGHDGQCAGHPPRQSAEHRVDDPDRLIGQNRRPSKAE